MHRHRHTPRSRGFTIIEVMIVIAILGILAASLIPMFVGGNMEEKRGSAIRAAEAFGLSGTTITASHRWASTHGCGQDDAFAFDATATTALDKKVSVIICCGRDGFIGDGKGCTVRVR